LICAMSPPRRGWFFPFSLPLRTLTDSIPHYLVGFSLVYSPPPGVEILCAFCFFPFPHSDKYIPPPPSPPPSADDFHATSLSLPAFPIILGLIILSSILLYILRFLRPSLPPSSQHPKLLRLPAFLPPTSGKQKAPSLRFDAATSPPFASICSKHLPYLEFFFFSSLPRDSFFSFPVEGKGPDCH